MRLNQFRWLVLLASLFHAPPTRACSAAPRVDATSVDGVATYPANAAILLGVLFYDTQDFTIEINDVPGILTFVPELSPQDEYIDYYDFTPAILAARISPEPMEGDTLRLQLAGCGNDCEENTWIWVAGPPDLNPPVTFSGFLFDLYQYPSYATGVNCSQKSIRNSWFFDVNGTTSQGESIEVYRLEVRTVADPETPIYSDTWYLISTFDKEHRWDTVLPHEGDPATSLCFTVTPMDLASHVGTSITTCQPQYCRIETEPLFEMEGTTAPLPEEPSWTEEDRFAGDACRMMPTTPFETPTNPPEPTDGDESSTAGCGCSQSGTSLPPGRAGSLLMGLGLMGAVAAWQRKHRCIVLAGGC